VCCSVLQSVAVFSSAVCRSVLQCVPSLAQPTTAPDLDAVEVLTWVRCCSVLQRVAACCSVLQRVAACCGVLQCVAAVAACCSAVCCSVLQCVPSLAQLTTAPDLDAVEDLILGEMSQRVAACCSVLQCSVLQYVAIRAESCVAYSVHMYI